MDVGLAKIGRKPCGEPTGQKERAPGKGSQLVKCGKRMRGYVSFLQHGLFVLLSTLWLNGFFITSGLSKALDLILNSGPDNTREATYLL